MGVLDYVFLSKEERQEKRQQEEQAFQSTYNEIQDILDNGNTGELVDTLKKDPKNAHPILKGMGIIK